MLPPSSTHLSEFDISSRNGFLPDQPPLQMLDDTYYASWEAIVEDLPALLNSSSLRKHVDQLPILSTSRLGSEREWQRAYLILSFLTHAYIWEAPGPSEVSVLFYELSRPERCLTSTQAVASLNLRALLKSILPSPAAANGNIRRAQPLEFQIIQCKLRSEPNRRPSSLAYVHGYAG